jgi:thiol-disulfide isomerase/thioredoxin
MRGLHRAELPVEADLPALDAATGWLNSEPLTPAGLRGSVVCVSFWTYSCVNWIRTLPYLRAWADKYGESGLVVLGVHTPEFGFEADIENVRQAAQAMGIDYPIALDSSYGIWRAFDNHYWPALYLVDQEGRIRHHQYGEGDYERSEMVLQRLLAESGRRVPDALVSVSPHGIEAAADWEHLRSPETYVGYARAERFASPGGLTPDEPARYTAPSTLRLNKWALAGDWTVGREAAVLDEADGRISFRFHARDVNLVMGPGSRGASVAFRVLLDGKEPGAARGSDIDEDGSGKMSEPRCYQLIRQSSAVTERTCEIVFFDPQVEANVFTFG